jgi:acetoin utilization deacetylase AcuC-like enzyme
MRVFFCDDTVIPLPDGHRFPHTKYRRLREALHSHPDVPSTVFHPSEAATWEQLGRVHTAEYLDAIRDGTLDAAAQRRLGFPWSPELVQRSRRSVGGTIAAAHWALRNRFAANLAGGTHHAFPMHGEGYCVFNDVAVAFRDLQCVEPDVRAAIIDLDVHQGNGNAAIFENEAAVFTFSMHGRRNFPFRKQKSSLDVELEDDCDDATYLAQLDRALPQVLKFRPDIVFYIAGADVLDADSLGLLNITMEGIAARDQRVLDALDSQRAPVVMVMGGGYSKPIERTVEAHTLSYATFIRRALQETSR